MPRARNSHRCGLVVDAERGPEIVAVGGTGASSDTVDIYNVDTYTWREGASKNSVLQRRTANPGILWVQ